MKTFDRLLLITWLLNVYDTAITLYGTQELGAIEVNPLMRVPLMVDPILFVIIKVLVATVVCVALHKRVKKHRKKSWAALVVIFGLYLMICLWNTLVVAVMLSR